MCCDRLVGAFAWVSVMACLTYCLAAYHPWAFVPLWDSFPQNSLFSTGDITVNQRPVMFFLKMRVGESLRQSQ